MNIHFGREQILRNIRTHGQTFVFMRDHKNTFQEPDGTQEEIASIQGLFHQTREFVTKNVSDGTVSRTKPYPMILCLVDENSEKIQHGDKFEYCNRSYMVIGVDDVNNLGIAYNISCEVFDDGL